MIDVHCHYYPERYTELMTRLGARNQPRFRYPTTDAADQLAARLQLMDHAGVQLQILCPASSYPYFERESDAVEAARLCNDSFAELTYRYPERFAAYVSLPLPHIDASLRELERGLDQLGMVGATVALSVLDRSTAEAEFERSLPVRLRPGTRPEYRCGSILPAWRPAQSAVGSQLAIPLEDIAAAVPHPKAMGRQRSAASEQIAPGHAPAAITELGGGRPARGQVLHIEGPGDRGR